MIGLQNLCFAQPTCDLFPLNAVLFGQLDSSCMPSLKRFSVNILLNILFCVPLTQVWNIMRMSKIVGELIV